MMRPVHTLWLATVATTMLLYATSARADAGLPMLMLTWPGMAIALVPIVAIEAFVIARCLQLRFVRAAKISLRANIVSTIVGVPLAWMAMLMLEFVTTFVAVGLERVFGERLRFTSEPAVAASLGAAWLTPFESDFYWMVPTAALVLLVPNLAVSCWLESLVALAALPGFEKARVRQAIFWANISSYVLLGACVAALLVHAIVTH
ncbi:MAG TPA: hypothetical protein VHE32_06380 [Rhodanobacteraceae bacterium]|jgi:hypothetical protein|nr:hypothetical protein [Rhodanobacteraceae bacterium]